MTKESNISANTVWTLKPEEIKELHRLFFLYKIHRFGVTDKGKVIIEYEDDFFCLKGPIRGGRRTYIREHRSKRNVS